MRTHILSILTSLAVTAAASAQSTAFTYQGRLKNGAALATGLHDFRFTLFNVASGGVQLTSPQCVDNILVAEGLFAATIDFGQQFATTESRFLQIEVRADTGLSCANSAGFLLLGPRQTLTAAPLATHAKSAFSLDAPDGSPVNIVFVDNAGNVGIATTNPQAPLHVNGTMLWGGTTSYAYSGEDAAGMFLEHKGTSTSTSKMRLQASKSGDQTNYAQLLIDPFAGFSFLPLGTGNGNVGIGTAAPLAKLDVRGDIRLGPTGQFRAASGDENLRLVRGNIDGNGAIVQGSGFTASRSAEGLYFITFVPPFAGIPSVTATAHWPTVGSQRTCSIQQGFLTSSSVIIDVNVAGTTNLTDSNFSFCAIGPR